MRKEITSTDELNSFISQVSINAPSPVKRMLNSQLQIIKTLKAPTLVDFALTEMVDGLYMSLEECSTDDEKKLVRRQFSSMIVNLIFFLDADLHKTIQDDDQLAKKTFLTAGDLFMDNMRDIMVCSINTFGTTGKIIATSADHIGKDVMITLNGATAQVVNAVGASGFDATATAQENCSTQSTSFHKDPMSDEAVRVNKEISNEVIGKIDQHRGEMAKEVNDHIDNWVNEMSNVIIHNFFSEERKEKTLSIFDSTMELLTKTKKEQKSMNDFLQTVSMTIYKLKKYRALIGPSIPISDMIERYVRVFKDAKVVSPDKKENFITKNLPKSLKKTFAFTSFGASSLASATSLASVTLATPFISVPIMVGSIVAGYYASTLLDNDRNAFVTLDIALDEYMNIANSYNPFNEQQQ